MNDATCERLAQIDDHLRRTGDLGAPRMHKRNRRDDSLAIRPKEQIAKAKDLTSRPFPAQSIKRLTAAAAPLMRKRNDNDPGMTVEDIKERLKRLTPRRGVRKPPFKPLTPAQLRQRKTPIVEPKRSKLATLLCAPTHLSWFQTLRHAEDDYLGKYIVPAPEKGPEAVGVRRGARVLESRVSGFRWIAKRSGGVMGVKVGEMEVLVLLQRTRREMAAVRQHAASQEETFRKDMERTELHKVRQAEHEKFIIAFGGALGVDSYGYPAHDGRVLTGVNAYPEFEDVGIPRSIGIRRIG